MGKLIQAGISALGVILAATTLAQVVGLYWLWQRGLFSAAKRDKIAAIAFGIDISRWEPEDPAAVTKNRPPTEQQLYQSRVDAPPIIAARRKAASREIEALRGTTELHRIDRDRYGVLRKSFAEYLDQMETALRSQAISELRGTLTALPAKQSKDLILKMLDDEDTPDAMTDLLEVLRTTPIDKAKKIYAEFKSEEEAQTLHNILVELGELETPRNE